MGLGQGGKGAREFAFTLVELLVTLAILLVLSALAVPAMARAQQWARAVPCLGNLRQWGIAVHLYADDHDDQLPPEGFPNPTERHTNIGWYVQLPRELRLPPYHTLPWRTNAALSPGITTWLCPANRRRSNGRNLFHYCLNELLDGTGGEETPTRVSAIPEPSRAVVMFDSKNLPAVGTPNFVHTNLHRGGAQVLFLDGHSRQFRRETYWDAARDRARTNTTELLWSP